MPFSTLGQSSKMAAAAIARPCNAAHLGASIGAHGHYSRPRVPSVVSCSPPYPEHRNIHTASIKLSCKATLIRTHEKAPAKKLARRARSTIAELFRGNEEYMAAMSKDNPGLLASLAKDGQRECVSYPNICALITRHRPTVHARRLLGQQVRASSSCHPLS